MIANIINGNGWSVGAWADMLDTFEAEAQRRCRYDVRRDEFIVHALIRLHTSMAISIAVAEGVRGIEAAYRRYLRHRRWVTDCIAN